MTVRSNDVKRGKRTSKVAEDRPHSKALRALPSTARRTSHVQRASAALAIAIFGASPLNSSCAFRRARWIWILGFALLWPTASFCPLQAAADDSWNTPATDLVWPPPPDEPRIAYVQSIANPSDAGIRGSGLRRFANWLSGAREGNESLGRPFGLALDEADNLCITDTRENVVLFFDKAGRRCYRWEQIGAIRFASPVAVAKLGRTLFVADSAIPAILAFKLEGKLLFRSTENITRPSGLAISGDRLLVADVGGHCIAVFDLHGKFLSRFGVRGTGPGQFNFPTHVAADSHGSIYVTDSVNNRVQVFDSKGNYVRQIGGPGDGPGAFSRPKGVAIDAAGRVYVVDAVFQNVQIFDSDARLLLDFGRPGSGPGEFWLPNGIAIGRDNKIYVSDSYNSRVQVFKYLGKQ